MDYATTTRILDQLDRIEAATSKIQEGQGITLAEIDDLKAEVGKLVADIDTELSAARATAADLQQQLSAAVASGSANAAALADMKATAVDLTAQLTAADDKLTAVQAVVPA